MKYIISMFVCTLLFTQSKLTYTVAFTNLAHHEVEMSLLAEKLEAKPYTFVMSRTSPGRYALHEFSKNVYQLKFYNSKKVELPFKRVDLHHWEVKDHDGEITAVYTLFGDRTDGTYTGIDETHVHLNAPASFLWVKGLEKRPIQINFPDLKQKGWTVASQLNPISSTTFSAPDLFYFMDSPIEISHSKNHTWTVGNQSIHLNLHHNGTENDGHVYAKMAEAITLEQEAVFGELPTFDYGNYTFLADYLSYVNGDGMEHRNSTILTSPRSLDSNKIRNLGTLSHEFFHAWNIERIRPKSLEPFNFENANVSEELWFGEGFTSYYDFLFITRAGLVSTEDFLNDLNGRINKVMHSPARHFYSATEMSQQAPFVDAAKSVDPQNKDNTFISYYTWGSAIGLALDLELRHNYQLTLDGFMKRIWETYGKSERPYTNQNLQDQLAIYTYDRGFTDNFFNRYIYGNASPDFKTLLNYAGFDLALKKPNSAWIGNVKYEAHPKGLRIESGTIISQPIYKAGLDRGDIILSVNAKTFKTPEDLKAYFTELKVGETITMRFIQREKEQTVKIKTIQNPELMAVTFESQNKALPKEILNLRTDWLAPLSLKSNSLVSKLCRSCKQEYPAATKFCTEHGETLEYRVN